MSLTDGRTAPRTERIAVYIDFDNIVISRREQAERMGVNPTVDVDALLDFAASFGTLTTSRAYADWARPEVNAYRLTLLERAVDTIQMFTTSGRIKNAADIRLAIDVVEDMYQLPDITHVLIVAGDSDYIPLAQRVKRLGRYVVGIGVAGSTSRLLAAACDEFYDYDDLPGLHTAGDSEDDSAGVAAAAALSVVAPSKARGSKGGHSSSGAHAAEGASADAGPSDAVPAGAVSAGAGSAARATTAGISRQRATQLLLRALEYSEKRTENDWAPASQVKNQMLRMEPGFQESALGFSTFLDFVRSRGGQVEVREDGPMRYLRRRGR